MIPDITALWVVGFVLITIVLLNTLVFKPILAVIEARLKAVSGARDLAESAAQKARAATAEYNEKLDAVRSTVYREMDEKRHVALEKRAALLSDTKAVIEKELSDAAARVRQQSADARATLDRDAEAMAGAIVTRVLGRAS